MMDQRPPMRERARQAGSAAADAGRAGSFPDSPLSLPSMVSAPPDSGLNLGRSVLWASRLLALIIIVYLCFQGTKWLGTFAFGLAFIGVALDVYLTFRILKFPDLTIDGSFPLGACFYAAANVMWGWSPLLATIGGMLAGALAGLCTGLLHTRLKIDGLLASIIVMTSLYTVNLRIMSQGQTPIDVDADKLFTPFYSIGNTLFGRLDGQVKALATLAFFACIALVLILILNWFLHTELGLALRATGDNEYMIRALGVNTDNAKLLILALANGLAGLCGALIAPYQGFADVTMGRGMIVVGLAAVIIGESLIAPRSTLWALISTVVGAIVYRVIYTAAISFEVVQALLVRLVLTGIALALVSGAIWWVYSLTFLSRTRSTLAIIVGAGIALGSVIVIIVAGLLGTLLITPAMERASIFKLQVEDIELALSVLIVIALAVPGIRKSFTTRTTRALIARRS